MSEAANDELICILGPNKLSLTLDEQIYPRDAILGASYLFLDRCYLFLRRPADQQLAIDIKGKTPLSQEDLEALAGEFANELLNQVIRCRVSDSTAKIREYYMARAFISHPAQNSIDALLAELDAEELEEDELEIAVPWEQNDG